MSHLLNKWERFIEYGVKMKFEKGEIVYYQGQHGNCFFYLDSGSAVNRYLSFSGEERFINHVSQGMLFGEEGLNGDEYISTVEATSSSIVYSFTADVLQQICKEYPQAAMLFICSQVENFSRKVEVFRNSDSKMEEKIHFYLIKSAHDSWEIPVNQSRLAKDLGTSRVTVNKVFQKWIKDGSIKLLNNKVQIINEGWLEEISSS